MRRVEVQPRSSDLKKSCSNDIARGLKSTRTIQGQLDITVRIFRAMRRYMIPLGADIDSCPEAFNAGMQTSHIHTIWLASLVVPWLQPTSSIY